MLTLVLLAASILAPSPSTPILTPAFDVSVSIAPSSLDHYQLLRRKTPETFTCRAWVSDASSNSGFGWAELVVTPGSSAQTTKALAEGYTMEFSVTLKASRADSVVTIKRGERLITRQRSAVHLEQAEGNIPLR